MKAFAKELLLVVISLIPLLALIVIYPSLPETIPTHFGFNGPDAWGNKQQLFLVPGIISPALYILLFFIPRFDPKNRIAQMGNKWYALKLLMSLFFMGLNVYILHETRSNGTDMASFLMVLFGAFFAGLGNYFQTIRPNYFIGIRTPWTLENEEVWKATHLLAGKIWVIGGLAIMPLYFLQNQYLQATLFITAVAILALVPIVFSYFRYKSTVK